MHQAQHINPLFGSTDTLFQTILLLDQHKFLHLIVVPITPPVARSLKMAPVEGVFMMPLCGPLPHCTRVGPLGKWNTAKGKVGDF